MIIIVLVLLIIVGCFTLGIKAEKTDDRTGNFFLGGIILFMLILCWVIPYTQSAYKIAEMRTFQNVDAVNMKNAIEKTLSQIDSLDKSKFGLEKIEGYKTISERMAEMMNKIEKYNRDLTGYNWYNSNPFLSGFIASVKDLDYIEIEDKWLR